MNINKIKYLIHIYVSYSNFIYLIYFNVSEKDMNNLFFLLRNRHNCYTSYIIDKKIYFSLLYNKIIRK